MGLGAFVEDAWRPGPHTWLRIVLTPSFHPESCVTITDEPGQPALSVVTLVESFWYRGAPSSRECETVAHVDGLLDRAMRLARPVLEREPGRDAVALDGMNVAVARHEPDRSSQAKRT